MSEFEQADKWESKLEMAREADLVDRLWHQFDTSISRNRLREARKYIYLIARIEIFPWMEKNASHYIRIAKKEGMAN